jgi:hypothetical protein
MKRARVVRGALGILAVLALCSAGCLEFEKQTSVWVFPPGTQEIRCLLVYESLHIQGKGKGDIDSARKTLAHVFEKDAGFYLTGPFVIDVVGEAKDDDNLEARAFRELMKKHLAVRKGAFFLDGDGKLCAYQTIHVRDRDALVARLNRIFDQAMKDFAVREKGNAADPDRLDDETLRLIERAGEEGFRWLRLEPGRLSFTMPATATGVERIKHNSLKGDEGFVRWLLDNPVSFEQRRDRFTVALGVGDGEPIRYVEKRGNPVGADADLIAHARTLKVPFKTGLTARGLIDEFLKTGVAERK